MNEVDKFQREFPVPPNVVFDAGLGEQGMFVPSGGGLESAHRAHSHNLMWAGWLGRGRLDNADLKKPVRQYLLYFGTQCYGWHDEGTGPMSGVKENSMKGAAMKWRDKPND